MLAIDRRTPLLLAIAAATAMLALTGWQGYQFWQNETQRTPPQPTREASTGADQARTVPDVQLSIWKCSARRLPPRKVKTPTQKICRKPICASPCVVSWQQTATSPAAP